MLCTAVYTYFTIPFNLVIHHYWAIALNQFLDGPTSGVSQVKRNGELAIHLLLIYHVRCCQQLYHTILLLTSPFEYQSDVVSINVHPFHECINLNKTLNFVRFFFY
jgi:hypothetical protein